MIYDIHCHLEGLSSGLMEDLPKKNLSIILNGLDYGSNEKILQLSKNNPLIHCAMGMHPTNDFDEKIINQIKNNSKSIRAIGEVGLDFKQGFSQSQVDNFKKIITLSQELNKPLIIHSRNAEKTVIENIEGIKVPAILHCFSGKKKLAIQLLSNPNAYFSIPASAKYSEQFQELIKIVPIERLFCETDSPYLWKEGKNTPLNVIHSYEMIAKIKNISLTKAQSIIENNFKKVFSNKP